MMITLIFKTYLTILSGIGITLLAIFLLGCYFIWRIFMHPARHANLSLIAGEDMIATQFDLARAYFETNQKNASKVILKSIIATGNRAQIREAKLLLEIVS